MITLVIAVRSLDGYAGATAIIAGAIVVAIYSGFLAYLLRSGRYRAVFAFGFLLDNLVVIFTWWFTASHYRPANTEDELWLILMPLVIVGIVRTGPRLGLAYTAMLGAVLFFFTIMFEPHDTHSYQQLPARLGFFGLVGAVTTWLAAELNNERFVARELQEDTEDLYRISQIIGPSLEPTAVFEDYIPLLRSMVPFETLLLTSVDTESGSLKVLNVDSRSGYPLSPGEVVHYNVRSAFARWLDDASPVLMTEENRSFIKELYASVNGEMPGGESLILVPIVSADQVLGMLIACSSSKEVFAQKHRMTLTRVGQLVGAALTNQRLYTQARELAVEREARMLLDAANRRLQEDNEAQSHFLSAVSHELRTPLTSIIAFNDLLLRNKKQNLDARQLDQLNLIHRNSNQLLTLVNDLLDLSYIGSGKLPMSPEVFRPSTAIAEIAASMAPMLKIRRQTLRLGRAPVEAEITADRQRFAQVLGNLLSNASKYSDEGSHIHVEWWISGGNFELTVRDAGTGIPEAELKHLFQPFYRSPEHMARKIQGTGLGLVITRQLIQAHGGDVSVETSRDPENHGTAVKIWFPADGSALLSNMKERTERTVA
ncbi:MAG: GAF domain-containing sensor histidine kinase [Chloroflexi bacterium]|nr:GAF domain-containing sensor histidine kinase [Chloroflexota bacterium]